MWRPHYRYYTATYQDFNSNDESYIGDKTPADLPPNIDICDYNDPETKEYFYWYSTKPAKQPPAGLVDGHVACFYCLEPKFLDDEHKKQPLDKLDDN